MGQSVENLADRVEAVLFVCGEPVGIGRLARILGESAASVENAIMVLESRMRGGIVVVRSSNGLQLATRSDLSGTVEALVEKTLLGPLSHSALEVLAIVAYRAPVSRADIEAIRGVNSSFLLRTLLIRGLIDRVGGEEGADSRAYLYSISAAFLRELGLKRPQDLPDFSELSKSDLLDRLVKKDEEM